MWIESIGLTAFGNLSKQKIEFKPNMLNLVVEPNEFGKSTIAEAIWAVLFDYPQSRSTPERLKRRDVRQPQDLPAYKASLDVQDNNFNLRIVRDFQLRTVSVFDRGRADLDVTEKFMAGPSADQLGFKLTGMSRELFKNTCFVGQGELERNRLVEDGDLSSLLQTLADSSGGATTSAAAIVLLDDALSQFSYQDKKMKADKLLKFLDEQTLKMEEKLAELWREHEASAVDIRQIDHLDQEIKRLSKKISSIEYFQLCLDVADLDSRILKGQENLVKIGDLKADLNKFQTYSTFPADVSPLVDELWTKWQARLNDLRRVEAEIDLLGGQVRAGQQSVGQRWPNLLQFTTDDLKELSSLVRMLSEVQSELFDYECKRNDEERRILKAGFELNVVAGTRKALLNLEAKDLDNAMAYNAMILAAKEQLKDSEGLVWRVRQIIPEIESERRIKSGGFRTIFILVSLVFFVTLAFTILLFVMPDTGNISFLLTSVGVLVALAGSLLAIIYLWRQAKDYRAADAQLALSQEKEQTERAQQLLSKVLGLEIRLDDLARRAGLLNGAELMRYLKDYTAAAPQLKELDLLEHLVASRQAQVIKWKNQIEPYLAKAQRNATVIDANEVAQLVDDIARCHEELRAIDALYASYQAQQTELKFLNTELNSIDAQLAEQFRKAGCNDINDLEQAHENFVEAAKNFHRLEDLKSQLIQLESNAGFARQTGNLPDEIARWQSQRKVLWSKIEELMTKHPEIAQMPPSSLGDDQIEELLALRQDLDVMAKQRDELVIRVRAATVNYDQQNVRTKEELEDLKRYRLSVKRAKMALELAKETFGKLSDDTHRHWSDKLNEISKQMLSVLKTDFESLSFDPNLKLTARRKGKTEPLQTANINDQMSAGSKEQLHWLARMAVCRYLSSELSLPIVLDEPFSEADDERFLATMRFLIDTVVPDHQVIVFSCHHKRHEWLMEELSDSQKDKLNFCRLQAL